MLPQAHSPGARVLPAPGSDRTRALAELRQALLTGRNADGGWGYYAGKTSRLEPTCWAMLALAQDGSANAGQRAKGKGQTVLEASSAWLSRCQQPSGWLVENPDWPMNIAFNALAAFTCLQHPALVTDAVRKKLFAAIIASKGAQAPQSEAQRQDNSLQGWSWIDGTFSWVEPTCWGLLALKKARGSGTADAAASARIAEAERLLVDRACQPGGWNFGNATVMRQDLRPYVPTTALGLLAMQDRRDEAAVQRGLAFLEQHWSDEISASALGLTLICLSVFGRPTSDVASRLGAHAAEALAFGNFHGTALALVALNALDQVNVFKL